MSLERGAIIETCVRLAFHFADGFAKGVNELSRLNAHRSRKLHTIAMGVRVLSYKHVWSTGMTVTSYTVQTESMEFISRASDRCTLGSMIACVSAIPGFPMAKYLS